ncbi:MAG TPA: TonB-dependent receptor [Gemmatimonadaceae bacterium]|nr:TonB-dependent receptor [Gemmatimonadaceae bacterium]
MSRHRNLLSWLVGYARLGACLVVTAAVLPGASSGQDTAAVRIGQVTVTREAGRSILEIPYALSRIDLAEDRIGSRRSSLAEILYAIPGVQVWNRFNPSQDPRIGVRGFGARSAFGIRGVRILRDGIPLTLADGQTAVDFLDLETLSGVEVLRGSAGALYGNASGGVLDFRTRRPLGEGWQPELASWYTADAWRLSGALGLGTGRATARVASTFNEGSGFRTYSRYRNRSVSADLSWRDPRRELVLQVYRAPRGDNPGALTAAELSVDPSLADSQNIVKKSGKTASHTLAAFQMTQRVGGTALSASLHAGKRTLDNPQPFAIVTFDRATGGGSLRAQTGRAAKPLLLSAGADYLVQYDDRRNYANCAGTVPRPPTCPSDSDRGATTLDQEESVTSVGVFVRAEIAARPFLSLTGTVRNDRTRFSVLDRRNTQAGEQSRAMGALSPMVGLNWKAGERLSLYANVASSFETPTTTELANQPDGSGGLNRELQPQRGRSYEVGLKMLAGRALVDGAIFRIETRQELVPFEIPGGGGRRYFRNAGRTRRSGAEVGVRLNAGALDLGASASWLRYRYVDYAVGGTNYSGRTVPGVPPFALSMRGTWHSSSWTLAIEVQQVARAAADDANSNYAPGYTKIDMRLLGGTRWGLQPVIGVDNALDRRYAANVVTNASRGRYYEPGAPRTFYFGMRLLDRR